MDEASPTSANATVLVKMSEMKAHLAESPTLVSGFLWLLVVNYARGWGQPVPETESVIVFELMSQGGVAICFGWQMASAREGGVWRGYRTDEPNVPNSNKAPSGGRI